jgi:hypothetical protein
MLPGETRHLLSSDPLRMSAESGLVRTRLSLRASIVTVIAGSVGLIVLGGRALETRFYRAAMPPEIELAFDLATTASGMSLLEAATPLRHEDCGGAIFGLSNRMAASLRDRGALADARQGRGYTDTADPLFFHYSYEPWQPTPLPPEWTSNVVRFVLHEFGRRLRPKHRRSCPNSRLVLRDASGRHALDRPEPQNRSLYS